MTRTISVDVPDGADLFLVLGAAYNRQLGQTIVGCEAALLVARSTEEAVGIYMASNKYKPSEGWVMTTPTAESLTDSMVRFGITVHDVFST